MYAVATLSGLCLFSFIMPAFAALTPKEVLHLAKHPEAEMIDEETCELRDAIYGSGTDKLLGAGHYIALFRHRMDAQPFAEGVTLADSTVTIRFKAKAGDHFYGRAYKLDKNRRKIVNSGPTLRHVCVAPGQVAVGDVEQVKQQEAADKAENTTVTGAETPRK